MAIGAIIGAAAGSMLASGASSAIQAHMDKKAMEYAYKLQRKSRQNSYQDTVYSLKDAGLNPMLAIQNGPVQGNMSPVRTKGDPVQLSQIQLAQAQAENQREQANTAKTQQALNLAQQGKVQADTMVSANTAKMTALDAKQRERVGRFENNWFYENVLTPANMYFKAISPGMNAFSAMSAAGALKSRKQSMMSSPTTINGKPVKRWEGK
jgi:hypothetical protein